MLQFEHVKDLLETAQKIEIGAAERYREYAEIADTENPEIAALFNRLAEEEKKHEECVMQLADEASVNLSDSPAPDQQIPSIENENTTADNKSLYEILAAAVEREDLAFEIYSQIAASSNNDDVCHYAERLAKEELGHAALLRAMRRRVYHEHKAQAIYSLPAPDKLDTVEEFLITAYALEKSLSDYIENISDPGLDMSTCKEHSGLIINQLRDDINKSTRSSDSDINKLDNLSNQISLSGSTAFTLDNLLAECDSAYEYYDGFILKTGNEEIMNKALFLASQTLMQLILIQEVSDPASNST
jgi:rubrerythrin